MNQDQLFQDLQDWLTGQDIHFDPDATDASVTFRMVGPNGEWRCYVFCEDTPPLLQTVCRLPLQVPEQRLSRVAAVLNELNNRLRIGHFALSNEHHSISYRLPVPVYTQAPVEDQIATAIRMSMSIFNNNYHLLCALVAGGPQIRQRLLRLTGSLPCPPSDPFGQGQRPEWN